MQKYPQIQRYSDNDFYAYTRGNAFMAFTKDLNDVSKLITFHPYKNGQKLCNIFWPNDCIIVKNDSFTVNLENGEPKIYLL